MSIEASRSSGFTSDLLQHSLLNILDFSQQVSPRSTKAPGRLSVRSHRCMPTVRLCTSDLRLRQLSLAWELLRVLICVDLPLLPFDAFTEVLLTAGLHI